MLEPTLQTSFIPKRSLSASVVAQQGTGVLFVITLVLFLASGAVAGGVYINKVRLNNVISDPKTGLAASLDVARKAFDKEQLEAITRFDAKLRSGTKLLANHSTLIPLFSELGKYTLQTVRFTSMDFSLDREAPTLVLHGEANSYKSIALQSESYVASRLFKDVVFSNLNVDNKDKVNFDLSMKIDPILVSYIEAKRR